MYMQNKAARLFIAVFVLVTPNVHSNAYLATNQSKVHAVPRNVTWFIPIAPGQNSFVTTIIQCTVFVSRGHVIWVAYI